MKAKLIIGILLTGGLITAIILYLKKKKEREALLTAHKDLGLIITPKTNSVPAKAEFTSVDAISLPAIPTVDPIAITSGASPLVLNPTVYTHTPTSTPAISHTEAMAAIQQPLELTALKSAQFNSSLLTY